MILRKTGLSNLAIVGLNEKHKDVKWGRLVTETVMTNARIHNVVMILATEIWYEMLIDITIYMVMGSEKTPVIHSNETLIMEIVASV